MTGLLDCGRPYGQEPGWGFGSVAFAFTIWLLPPVLFLHIIVPSGNYSNREKARLEGEAGSSRQPDVVSV